MSFFRKLFFKKVAGIRDTYVLEEGDVALDESDGKLYRGDGSTVGGILIQSTAGISLTDISSATTAPSGGGALVYNNSNGQITYTPPDLSGLGGSSLTVQDEGSALSTAATTLNFVGAGVTATGTGATKTITIAGGGGGGLSNVVEDTTPQLGGDLDVNGNSITSTGDLTLDVTGDIVLDAGGEQIIFKDGSTNVGHIDLTNDDLIIKSLVSDADIVFKGNDNGTERTPFYLDMSVGGTAMFNAGIKNSNFFWCTSDNIVAFQAGGNGEIDLTHVHNTGFKLTNSGTGTPAVELQFVDSNEAVGSDGTNLLLKSGGTTFKIPTADGTSGQVLQTDGNGVLSFTTVSGGGGGLSNVVEDTTPQLGGDLDTNGNKITFADSVNAEFGDSGDLKIFHNGGHSIVRETGTGSLYLQSDNNVILSTDSSTKVMVKGIANGATELYHNDILKLNTSTSGVTIVDEVHTEGATPHLTLKRTDNANVPSLRFKGSGGTVGASIEFDGTAGTSNELIFKTFPGLTLTEKFRVTYNGTRTLGTNENTFTTLTGATGVVAHDCREADIFLHTTPAANWTANFTNLDFPAETRVTIEIMIVQGNTAYMPTAVQIGGVAQTVIYKGNNAPTGTDNGHNRVFFHIFNDGGTYRVYGDHDTYGGV